MNLLILLQGANPLPNWAVVQFLLQHGGSVQGAPRVPSRLLVIGTHEQRAVADRLKQVLQGTGLPVDAPRVTDANRGEQVAELVRGYVRKSGESSNVHLNYTGGTKVMAVHAARASAGATHSYLDASSHRLWVEDQGFVPPPQSWLFEDSYGVSCRIHDDLRLYVHLTLDDVFRLHGSERNPQPHQAHVPEQRFAQDGEELEEQIERYTSVWLDERLKGARQALGLAPVELEWDRNIHVRPHETLDAELDVLAMIGHQLLTISCTTTRDFAIAERKAYEVWFRSRQLGGEEACAMLVCSRMTQGQADQIGRRLGRIAGQEGLVHVVGQDKYNDYTTFAPELDKAVGWR